MNYNISIIDDSAADTEYAAALVRRWAKGAGHTVNLSLFPSAEAFLFAYEDKQDADLLLLDIEMGDMDGVSLAKKLRQTNAFVQLVFITGFPDFITEGYEVSALHYLMKPVVPEKLYAVLDKAAANLAKAERRLCITHGHNTDFVPLSQVLYIEAQKQYVLIHAAAGIYRMKTSLVEMGKELDETFFKCQRSFIVNLSQIIRIQNSCVVLKNGEEVPISRGMAEKIGREIIRLF